MDVDVKHSRDLLLLYGILLFFISPLFPFQWCWPCSNWHYSCYNGCGHPPKMIQWCFLQLLSYGALLQHRGISWFLVNKKKEFFKKKLFCKLKKIVFGARFFHEWNEGKIHNSTFKSQNQMRHLHTFLWNCFDFFFNFMICVQDINLALKESRHCYSLQKGFYYILNTKQFFSILSK